MIDGVLVAGAGVIGLAIGFLAGLFAYAHVHQHFFAKAEELTKRGIGKAVAAERAKEQKLREARQKLRAQFGNDLSAKHQDIIDEEVEKVLSGGPR